MRTICYYPALVQMTGSINAALMMAQLEFWFKVMAGKSFYKFIEPCTHELYKIGDSWSEELGMTSAEIRSAFKRIGIMYKSKSAFLESEDVFQGKPYAAYYDRMRKTIYYLRNETKVQEMMCFNQQENKVKEDFTQQENIIKGDCFTKQKSIPSREDSMQQDTQLDKVKITNTTYLFSTTQETQDGLYRENYINNNIEESIQESTQENVSSMDQVCKKHTFIDLHSSYPSIPFEQIVSLYNDKLGEKLGYMRYLTSLDKKHIKKLWCQYQIRLEDFEKAFVKVAQSKFLCGQVVGKKWRASFKWLLAEDHFMKVLEGMYDDFLAPPTFLHICPDKVKYVNQMESHNFDFEEIERLERLYIDFKLSELSGDCHQIT